MLSTNQVMEIAWDTVRTNRYKPDAYFCDFLLFTGNGTNALGTNKWLLHFMQKRDPWQLHSDLFVHVEDATGEARLFHH